MPRVCKQCRDDLDTLNCCYTGTANAKTRIRYMDNVCKACKRAQKWRRQELLVMYPRPPPDTPCECCGRVASALHMDHDHETGDFRAYICQQCNHGIGHLGDNLEGVKKAVAYLERCRR